MKKCSIILLSTWIALLAAVAPGRLMAADPKELFEEGLQHFQNGEFKEAAVLFRKANEIRPNWKILYNLGQSEAAAKQYGLAITSFEKYLSEGGDEISDARRSYVIRELTQMREMVGFLDIKAPNNIEIYIDDVRRGKTPFPMSLPVAASVEHTLVAVMDGNEVSRKTVMVMGQHTAEVVVEIETMQLESSSEIDWETTESAAEKTHNKNTQSYNTAVPHLKLAGNILLITGGVSLVAGTVTGILAMKRRSELDSKCPDGCYADNYDIIDRRDHLALTTDVLVAVGAASLVGGVILHTVARKQGRESVDIQPLIENTKVSVALTVRY